MNLLDILILTPLLLALFRGLYKGFINELASLIALISGIYLAYKWAYDLSVILSRYIKDGGQWNLVLAYILIFAAVALLVFVLSRALTRLAGALALGLVNRILGGLFGLVKGVLILLIITSFFLPFYRHYEMQEKPIFKESRLFAPLAEYSLFAGKFFDGFSAKDKEEAPPPVIL